MSKNKPLVTIVTPAHNAAPFIGSTIEAVINQSRTDWEMCIIDDSSSDGTLDLVRRYARGEPRIRFDRTPANLGAGPARNQGIRMGQGRFLAFLDADDLWDSDKLARQIEFAESQGHAFTYSGYRMMTESGRIVRNIRAPTKTTYDDLLKNTAIGCLTVMLDREQLGAIQFPSLRNNQDYALWLSILRRGFVAYGIPDCLASYRIVRNSSSRNKWKSAKGVWRILRQQENLSVPLSAWCFSHYAIRALLKNR